MSQLISRSARVEGSWAWWTARTLRTYADVVGLLRDCLNGYGYESLDPDERRRWELAFEDDEDAFVHLFGPEKITENLGEFLGYFMIRKVAAGQELLRAAGTVTAKLAGWLGERGYLDPARVGEAAERGRAAARDLPRADKAGPAAVRSGPSGERRRGRD